MKSIITLSLVVIVILEALLGVLFVLDIISRADLVDFSIKAVAVVLVLAVATFLISTFTHLGPKS